MPGTSCKASPTEPTSPVAAAVVPCDAVSPQPTPVERPTTATRFNTNFLLGDFNTFASGYGTVRGQWPTRTFPERRRVVERRFGDKPAIRDPSNGGGGLDASRATAGENVGAGTGRGDFGKM